MPDIPHFDLPLRYTGYPPRPAMVEQDSIEDIAACAQAIFLTEPGQRLGMPDFGVADQTFAAGGPDLLALRRALLRHEPRADAEFEKQWDMDEFIYSVRATITGAP